jgi:excinuclease ABC subunit A
VSGSGKSTLINDTLYAAAARHLYGSATEPAPHREIEGLEFFDKVINVDQSPIGRTPRSNPATYTGLLTPIRELFAGVPQSRERGYSPGRFSFNVKGGRCEACQGDGMIKVEMHFLPDIFVPCDVCHGKRYNRETLEVRYKGKTIHEVLQMTVEQAREFFDAVPVVARKLQTLVDVGLSYIQLGQSATTLSGGEAQRVKLALELSKRDTGRTLYILDEPTTGLHFQDIEMLLSVLHRLRDHGNTVVVIEHNLDVIKTADWIVDLGPEGGDGGGRIIASGTPEDVAKVKGSYTGRYLARFLAHRRTVAAPKSQSRRRGATKKAAMSGFENYSREALQIEHEIERKGAILGIDWNDAVQVRELARQALDCKLGANNCEPDDPDDRARIELFGLAQLMLTVMKESADQNLHTHGGAAWKAFARALWAEHEFRGGTA